MGSRISIRAFDWHRPRWPWIRRKQCENCEKITGGSWQIWGEALQAPKGVGF